MEPLAQCLEYCDRHSMCHVAIANFAIATSPDAQAPQVWVVLRELPRGACRWNMRGRTGFEAGVNPVSDAMCAQGHTGARLCSHLPP